jgi:hypothetical protein
MPTPTDTRVTVNLPAELYEPAKELAAATERSIAAVLRVALRLLLSEQTRRVELEHDRRERAA